MGTSGCDLSLCVGIQASAAVITNLASLLLAEDHSINPQCGLRPKVLRVLSPLCLLPDGSPLGNLRLKEEYRKSSREISPKEGREKDSMDGERRQLSLIAG